MLQSVNVSLLNEQLEKLSIDFRVKPLGDGTKFYWLYGPDNSYAMKVKRDFVLEFQTAVMDNLEDPRDLCGLFSGFEANVKSSFALYSYSGFLTKDYAEFYIDYSGITQDHSNGDVSAPSPFSIGDVSVKLSTSSSMLYFLYPGFEIEFNSHITIKLKGTSKDSVEDDLCAALHYLSLISPSLYGDIPTIVAAYPEELLSDDDDQNDVKLEKSELAKPSHPIALRYFYYADLLWGEERLLYYYKVLEYFFDIAWRMKIIDLVRESGENIEELAHQLERHQPKIEKDYLYFVFERIQTDKMWDYVTRSGFSRRDLRKLTENVYSVRNKVAHGKETDNFKTIVPSIISDSEVHRTITIFRFLAELALSKLGNVDSVGN